jgi:hypothetical protein
MNAAAMQHKHAANKVCQERIDAFEKALEKALGDTGAGPKDIPRAAQSPVVPSSPDGPDDIPFRVKFASIYQQGKTHVRGIPD